MFKIYQFTPNHIVCFNNIYCAITAFLKDVTLTIEAQCCEWHGVTVWPVRFVQYESEYPLDEHFKTFDAHFQVSHLIFFFQVS